MDTVLAQYVGAPAKDMAFIKQCASSAMALVQARLKGRPCPEEVLTQALLEVGANLYYRRTGRREVGVFGEAETGAPYQRPALDPLTPALPILRPYLSPPIA